MRAARLSRRWPRLLSVSFLALFTMFCGGREGCFGEDVVAVGPELFVNPDDAVALLEGGVLQIHTSTDNVAEPHITYGTTNAAVAAVSNSGLVTAVGQGNAVILINETTEDLSEDLEVQVVGFNAAAVILDHDLAAAYQAGDTIQLDRITHGRPADPDACEHVHLHTAFDQPGILIDGDNGPYADPNQPQCGFGRIIARNPSGAPLHASPMDHGAEH